MARLRSTKWYRNWGFGAVLTAICGLAAVQFVFFPVLTTPDRNISSNPNQSAQDRAEQIRRNAQQANDQQDLLQLVQSAHAARPVTIVQDIQKAATASSPATPASPSPGATQPPAVYGKNWGKESQPALKNFSKWAKDYANAPPPQQDQMLPEGLQLAQLHRQEMLRLIFQDPATAISSAVPRNVSVGMTREIRALLGNPLFGVGDLDVYGVTPGPDTGQLLSSIIRRASINGKTYHVTLQGPLAAVGSQTAFGLRESRSTDKRHSPEHPAKTMMRLQPLNTRLNPSR